MIAKALQMSRLEFLQKWNNSNSSIERKINSNFSFSSFLFLSIFFIFCEEFNKMIYLKEKGVWNVPKLIMLYH